MWHKTTPLITRQYAESKHALGWLLHQREVWIVVFKKTPFSSFPSHISCSSFSMYNENYLLLPVIVSWLQMKNRSNAWSTFQIGFKKILGQANKPHWQANKKERMQHVIGLSLTYSHWVAYCMTSRARWPPYLVFCLNHKTGQLTNSTWSYIYMNCKVIALINNKLTFYI